MDTLIPRERSFSSEFANPIHVSPFTADADESRRDELRSDSGFVPSQVDLHSKFNLDSDATSNPVFAEQNFFPSFFRSGQQLPPSRPFATRHVSSLPSGRYISNYQSSFDESILGSGDFTVLRGGTFYPEGEVALQKPFRDYFGSGSSFYDSKNSGRPFALPLESSHYSDDPFADFKDFADIAGLDTDFSQTIETFKEKHEPKNILEQLQQIDEEKSRERAHLAAESTALAINAKKLSKIKAKLLLAQQTKEPKKKEFIKTFDPLIAES